jgi:hypothetical protein
MRIHLSLELTIREHYKSSTIFSRMTMHVGSSLHGFVGLRVVNALHVIL